MIRDDSARSVPLPNLRSHSLYSAKLADLILTGTHKNTEALIPRIIFQQNDQDPELPFKLVRRQFPVVLAFALTINKSQGQSFEKVGVYLPTPVFQHGMMYVALSRCKNPNNLKIFVEEIEEKQGAILLTVNNDRSIYTKNIVFRQLIDIDEQ